MKNKLIVGYLFCSLIAIQAKPKKPNLRKKHIIIGNNEQVQVQIKQRQPEQKKLQRAFFSPHDNISQKLISYIKQEQKSIKVAIYALTDATIAQALIDAHNRGIKVEIIVDKYAKNDRFGKFKLLKSNHIPLFVYQPHAKSSLIQDIMHNKFVIFGNNMNNRSLVWTGSFNFTKSATKKNQENVVILEDKDLVDKFTNYFNNLKTSCKQSVYAS